MTHEDRVERLLEAQLGILERIAAAIEQTARARPAKALNRTDRERLARLLPVVGATSARN